MFVLKCFSDLHIKYDLSPERSGEICHVLNGFDSENQENNPHLPFVKENKNNYANTLTGEEQRLARDWIRYQ